MCARTLLMRVGLRVVCRIIGPARSARRREVTCLACVEPERLRGYLVSRDVRHVADLLQPEVSTLQDPIRIGKPDAVLEAEVHVLRLRRNEGEIAGSAPDGDVVADEPPAGPYPLGGFRHRFAHYVAQALGEVANLRRVARQE